MSASRASLIFLHTSDELYGADRMLLEILDTLPSDAGLEVWLPNDLAHPPDPLCEHLKRSGRNVRHTQLPILRRAYKTPSGLWHIALRAASLRRALKTAAPHTVYCTTSAALLCAPIARSLRIPRVIGHVQEMWSDEDRRLLSGPAGFCHRLIAISNAVRDSLPHRLQDRTRVVPNATTDPGPLQPIAHRPPGALNFLFASRWAPRKGIGTLLQAWEEAGCPGHLVLLGGPPPSGESVDVQGLVGRLSNPGTVSIVGETSDTSPYFAAADVVIVPSDLPEGFGLVAIEAFAHARPVIASAHGGMLEVVTPGHDGWMFPPHDVTALADLLRTLTRPVVVDAGNHARITFETRFTTQHLTQGWRQVMFGDRGPQADSESSCG